MKYIKVFLFFIIFLPYQGTSQEIDTVWSGFTSMTFNWCYADYNDFNQSILNTSPAIISHGSALDIEHNLFVDRGGIVLSYENVIHESNSQWTLNRDTTNFKSSRFGLGVGMVYQLIRSNRALLYNSLTINYGLSVLSLSNPQSIATFNQFQTATRSNNRSFKSSAFIKYKIAYAIRPKESSYFAINLMASCSITPYNYTYNLDGSPNIPRFYGGAGIGLIMLSEMHRRKRYREVRESRYRP